MSNFQKIWTENKVSHKTNVFTHAKTISIMNNAQARASTVFQEHWAKTAYDYPTYLVDDNVSTTHSSSQFSEELISNIQDKVHPNTSLHNKEAGCDVRLNKTHTVSIAPNTSHPEKLSEIAAVSNDYCSVQDASDMSYTSTTTQLLEALKCSTPQVNNTDVSFDNIPNPHLDEDGTLPLLLEAPDTIFQQYN